MHRVRTTTAAGALAALSVLVLLTGCGLAAGSGPAVASGDPSRCPGRVLDVVVSVAQWGEVVGPLTGPCATVTTVLASSTADPHEYEPTTGDIAAFQEADLVVLNGAGYDTWAARAVDGLDPGPAVVTAAAVAGNAGPDPHLWYQPDLVPEVADRVTAELSRLAPADATVFGAQAAAFRAGLRGYDDALAALRPLAAGRTYAATETVFDRTARAIGLSDVTPPGYRRAVSNDSEPAPGDVAALEQALTHGRADVLVLNTQTEGSVPRELTETAEKAGVPVVRVTESPPEGSSSFAGWQRAQLDGLRAALEAAR